MKKIRFIIPVLFFLCSCYTGSYFEDPRIIKAERYTSHTMGTAAIILDSGSPNVDIYVDDIKITSSYENSVSYISQPVGVHYIIFEIKPGDRQSFTLGYCIDTFNFQANDTAVILFKPVFGGSHLKMLEATIPQVSKRDLQNRINSGHYQTNRCSLDSILGCMYGKKYSRLMCEHSSGAKFIKNSLFDWYGINMNLGLTKGINGTNPVTITNGINIETELFGMFSPHIGIGLRTGYFGDNFVMPQFDKYGVETDYKGKLSQMEYALFLKICSAKHPRTNLFIEPGIGLFSGSSTITGSINSYYYQHFDTVKSDFSRFFLSVHGGVSIAFFELRSGFYYVPKDETGLPLKWYNINIGFSLTTKPKFKCD